MANLDKSIEMVDEIINKFGSELTQILQDVKKLGIGGPTYKEYLEQFEVRDTLNIGGLICNVDSIRYVEYLNDIIKLYLKNGITVEIPASNKLFANHVVNELESYEIFVEKV